MLQVPADVKQLAIIRRFIEECAAAMEVDADASADMVQAVDEAATNIIVHSYRGAPGTIDLEVSREGEWLVVLLRDQGPRFDPTKVSPPDLTLPLEQRKPGGLGIHLMRHFTDRMAWRTTPDGGNELMLAKRANAGSGASGASPSEQGGAA